MPFCSCLFQLCFTQFSQAFFPPEHCTCTSFTMNTHKKSSQSKKKKKEQQNTFHFFMPLPLLFPITPQPSKPNWRLSRQHQVSCKTLCLPIHSFPPTFTFQQYFSHSHATREMRWASAHNVWTTNHLKHMKTVKHTPHKALKNSTKQKKKQPPLSLFFFHRPLVPVLVMHKDWTTKNGQELKEDEMQAWVGMQTASGKTESNSSKQCPWQTEHNKTSQRGASWSRSAKLSIHTQPSSSSFPTRG